MKAIKLFYLIPYYMFNLLMGIIIGIVTYLPRLVIHDLRGTPVEFMGWLDKHFPLPPDDLFD